MPYTSDELDRDYPSDERPVGPDGGDYIVEMLADFGKILTDEPLVLGANVALATDETPVAANDRTAIEVNRNASDQQRQRALTDAHGDAYSTMADGLGPLSELYSSAMAAGDLPKTQALLSGRIEENIGDHEPAKATYDYKRPYVRPGFLSEGGYLHQVDSDGSYDGLSGNGSFPSGHANHGYSQGIVLATLLPDVASQIFARASEYGDNRIVLGFHYPMDVMGSRIVGHSVAQQRWSDPQFRAIMLQAQAELETVLAERCGTATVSDCADQADGEGDYLAANDAVDIYTARMTYGFDRVRAEGDPLIVPEGATDMLLTTFPELDEDQRELVLEATALDSGYALDTTADGQDSWQRINLAAAMAAQVVVDENGTLVVDGVAVNAEEPTLIEVAPAAVTFTDEDGAEHDTVTIPEAAGVGYTSDSASLDAGIHAANGMMTISAHALDGYVLAAGVTAEWTHTFDATDSTESATPDDGTGEDADASSGGANDGQGAAPATDAERLASTGADPSSPTTVALVLVAAGVALLVQRRLRLV